MKVEQRKPQPLYLIRDMYVNNFEVVGPEAGATVTMMCTENGKLGEVQMVKEN